MTYDEIQNEEETSKDYTIRILNNFASLMTLFDNFIFDEEFISLGDEEYFKERDNYNQLLKLFIISFIFVLFFIFVYPKIYL